MLVPTMKPLESERKKIVQQPIQKKKVDLSNVEIDPYDVPETDFDTFKKSDYRVVRITNCEPVEKSNKLLKFTLDDGTGKPRTILSGIKMYYQPEELIGKNAVAIVNLAPKKMCGIDSCGMLISAVHHENGEEGLHLLMVDDEIPAGTKLF